jgi:hypothetical protein
MNILILTGIIFLALIFYLMLWASDESRDFMIGVHILAIIGAIAYGIAWVVQRFWLK